MPADLIVYALVAAGLVLWLRNILGTQHGEERKRESPVMKQKDDENVLFAGEEQGITAEARVRALAEAKDGKTSIENKNAEAGLIDISRADRDFDINFFLDGAQDAFVFIVEAFAAGDRETLKDLLGSAVYNAFEGAITAREGRNEKQETQIRAIRKAEIIEARMSGRTAYITLRVTAEEMSVTRDSRGEIIEGHPERVTAMKDIWTYSRDIRSRDPRWIVIETRGDFEDDNKIIPNTH